MDDLERLAGEIRDADTVVALTGAGISAPSGIPTFRGDDGVWERFEEGQFRYGRFQRDPGGYWRDRIELQREMYGDETYEPNEAHLALADLADEGALSAIVTQNVDGLHHQASRLVADDRDVKRDTDSADTEREADPAESERGTDTAGDELDTADGAASGVGGNPANGEIVELHGNSRRVVCTECGRRTESDGVMDRVRDGECPPRCDCGGVLKPDVVMFGEQLPAAALQRSRSLAHTSDVFLAIGSSLVVEPAASLPRFAAANGATLAVVNLESTPRDSDATYVFEADVTDVLPRLRDLALSA